MLSRLCILLLLLRFCDSCSSEWRPWKQCLPEIERCQEDYCVFQVWIVMLISLVVLTSTFGFVAIAFVWFDKLVNLIKTVVTLVCVTSLGIILVGNVFAFA